MLGIPANHEALLGLAKTADGFVQPRAGVEFRLSRVCLAAIELSCRVVEQAAVPFSNLEGALEVAERSADIAPRRMLTRAWGLQAPL